jgi:uncharacterized RDD family membrane protein YckC
MESSDPFLDFGRDAGWRGVSGAEVVSAPGSHATGSGMAPTREDTEDALHSRLNAAIIDQILVGLCTGVVALVLRLTFASLAFAAVAVAVELLYFFVEETRSGQTIGKRQYGVRVVNLDGSRPGARTIAFRTLGRILDALPAYHASGLLTMIGTGRRRRQRIGDVLAHTTVVAAPGGRALAPRRRWLLPLLTVLATAFSVAVIVVAVDRSPASSALRSGFMSGCERGGASSSHCGCVFNAIVAAGYTDSAAWESLEREVTAAQASDNPALLPAGYVSAVRSCGTP